MTDIAQFLPHDRRFFVHRRIGAAAKGFVTSGFNPLGAAAGFISGGGPTATSPPPRRTGRSSFASRFRSARLTAPRSTTARPSVFSAAEKEAGREVKFSGGQALVGPSDCIFPFRPDPVTGRCKIFAGRQTGPDDAALQIGPGTPVGEAVMGRYGAALVPGSKIVDRAVCLPGMQLGDDGFCYNRGQISNSQRMWPRGRRPLLTGGEMRAISIAARAAGRLTRTAVRLQELGLIKKPVARKPRKKKSS